MIAQLSIADHCAEQVCSVRYHIHRVYLGKKKQCTPPSFEECLEGFHSNSAYPSTFPTVLSTVRVACG